MPKSWNSYEKTRAELERDLEGLAADLTTEASKLDLVLRIFVDSGLVFLLPETPYDRYQLVHDYLAEFIRKQQESRLNELIAELEKEKGQRKLTEEELKRTEQAKQILAVANQKAKRRVQVGSAILLAAVAALILAGRVVRDAQAQRKEAVSQADVAKHEASQAKADLKITKQKSEAANYNLKLFQDKLTRVNQKVIDYNKQIKQANKVVADAEESKRNAEFITQQANLNLRKTQTKLIAANRQLQQANQELANAKAERVRIDQQAKQELQAVIQKMEAAREQVETARLAAHEAKLLQQQLEAESENARKELAQRVAELDELNINLSQAQTQLNFLDRVQADLSASIQETLINIEQQTQQKSAVIYVTLGTEEDDKLALWLVTSEGSLWKQVPEAVSEEVKNIAKTFIDSVSSSRGKNDKYRDSSQQLYQWIIAPIEKELNKQNINNLVFLIDSPIPTIPLAALHDGKKFLVEKYSIGLMPGLTLTDNRHLDIKNASLLAMGISNLVTWTQPGVPVELSIIRDIWSGQVTTFLNEEVTINNLKVQRKKQPYQIIHIATVGAFKSGNPEEQYLQLWDNKLQLDQLEQVGWYTPPVELLVLSTSPSGVSDERTKYGFAGLAVQAGVKSVLGTLWYNLEVSHLVLMAEFYHHLQTTPIKAEALRQSQLAMLRGQVRIEEDQLRTSTMSIPLPPELYQPKERDFSHPYYWSGFTLIGNPW